MSRFKEYYNIHYLNSDRSDTGIYLRKGEQWSYSLPIPIEWWSSSSDSSSASEQTPEVETERIQLRPPSRQVSPVEIDHRQEAVNHPSLMLHPQQTIRAGQVYRLPERDEEEEEAVSPRTRRRSAKRRLPPQQEHMQLSIAQSLMLGKQSKASGFLDRLLRK